MPFRSRLRLPLAAALASMLLSAVACGGAADEVEDTLAAVDAEGGAAAAPPAAAAATADDPNAPLTVDDIDRWQRGMEAELQAVRDAGAQLARATSAGDSATAIFATNETSTRAAGAAAAGVGEGRYGTLRSSLSGVTRYMVPLAMEMDVSAMTPEMTTMMQESRDQSLAQASQGMPPEVLEALRPRAEALRRQEMALVGERLKAAGIGG